MRVFGGSPFKTVNFMADVEKMLPGNALLENTSEKTKRYVVVIAILFELFHPSFSGFSWFLAISFYPYHK